MHSLYRIFYTFALFVLFPGILALHKLEERDPSLYRAPLHQPGGRQSIDDTYIVKFFEHHTLEQHYDRIKLNLSQRHNLLQGFNFLPGYHARLEQDLLERVRLDPGVHYVEQDHVKQMHSHELHVPRDVDEADDAAAGGAHNVRRWVMNVIESASWSRAMMSEGQKFIGTRGAKRTARFIKDVGKGVTIYILDSGIRLTHQEFEGRASNFQGATESQFCNGESMEDTDGHGTAVASVAGGKTYGMASSASLVSVKVLCKDRKYRTSAAFVAAIEGITAEHVSQKEQDDFRGSVINMSFGFDSGTKSEAEVLAKARILGMSLVAAAGNSRVSSIQFPCGHPGVICAGACTRDYTIWDDGEGEGSNYGPHLTLFAPGNKVTVAAFATERGGYPRSGTSIASPNIAGILAGFVGYENLHSDADTAQKRLMDNALRDALDDLPGGSPNVLANNGIMRTPQIGIPDQLPYIGAPAIEHLQEGFAKLQGNSSQSQDGGLSSIITITSQSTGIIASSAAVLAVPTMDADDCGPQVAVFQWKDYTTTTTIQAQATVSS